MNGDVFRTELGSRLSGGLNEIIGGGSPSICLIDPPIHSNVGDCAILLGEMDYLEANYASSRLISYDIQNYSDLARGNIEASDVILIHGGGNFGDIWPNHHGLRLRVLDKFKHKKIVQMPQSIHFSNPDSLEKTRSLIAQQKNYVLVVRDKKSFEFASKQFDCDVRLLPDMAFAMKPIARVRNTVDIFCLLRTDKEVVLDHAAVTAALEASGFSFDVDDWLEARDQGTPRSRSALRQLLGRIRRTLSPFRTRSMAWRRRFAEQRVAVGVDLLSRGRIVVTDRLHAHIMSCLLGIPNVAFNSYDGKVSALYETWTHADPDARLCSSVTDLPQALADLNAAH